MPLSRIREVQPPPDSRPGPVIVVLGYHEFGDDGSHGISEICRAGVRRAEALAADLHPRAVIFTGWSSTGGASEAEQMAAAWAGREDVELIRETTASNTAENAVRSLAMLPGLEGSAEVIVVCSVRHFPRVRYLFSALFRRHGYRVALRVRDLAAAVGAAVAARAVVDHADGARPARRAGRAARGAGGRDAAAERGRLASQTLRTPETAMRKPFPVLVRTQVMPVVREVQRNPPTVRRWP